MSTTFDQLTITNDFLFKKVMQNKRICKHLIEEILHISDWNSDFFRIRKKHRYLLWQPRYPPRCHGTRWTLHAVQYWNAGFASDVINEDTGLSVLPKRTRYYQAMLDMDLLKKRSALWQTQSNVYYFYLQLWPVWQWIVFVHLPKTMPRRRIFDFAGWYYYFISQCRRYTRQRNAPCQKFLTIRSWTHCNRCVYRWNQHGNFKNQMWRKDTRWVYAFRTVITR